MVWRCLSFLIDSFWLKTLIAIARAFGWAPLFRSSTILSKAESERVFDGLFEITGEVGVVVLEGEGVGGELAWACGIWVGGWPVFL